MGEGLMKNHEKKETMTERGTTFNRRQFIGTAAAGALAIPGILKHAAAGQPEDKLKIGLIGCGWYGMVDLKAAFKAGGVECAALCDVDNDHLKNSADAVEDLQGSRPKTFKDYRKFLEDSDLQAVIIATPPQWHALPFLAALDRGLDIYCEKPLAYDIREGQAMVQAAKKSKQIIQIGFQRRTNQTLHDARAYIQQGNIGQVVQVEAQIHYESKLRDTTPQDPPLSLDWDWWCGPGPKLPYSPNIGHFAWRLEKAYGNGHLVDWGIHWIDAVRLVLNETMPQSVQAAGGIYYLKDKITTPDILQVFFDFASCPVTWRHRIWGAREYAPEISNGIFFYGEKGTVFLSDNRWISIADEKGSEPVVHEARSDAGLLMIEDFLQAVRTRRVPLCTPEDGFNSTATVQLAMIALDAEQKINWDHAAGEIVGNSEAARLLKRGYRAPWIHPYQD
jgi:predicted dehydrogenase